MVVHYDLPDMVFASVEALDGGGIREEPPSLISILPEGTWKSIYHLKRAESCTMHQTSIPSRRWSFLYGVLNIVNPHGTSLFNYYYAITDNPKSNIYTNPCPTLFFLL